VLALLALGRRRYLFVFFDAFFDVFELGDFLFWAAMRRFNVSRST
jgi:hypothetical protein